MSRESYVKIETAQLLKEKGFDWGCNGHWYIGESKTFEISPSTDPINWNEVKTDLDWLSCPTQQMVCRWLREEHNILVAVLPCEVGAGVDDYTYVIYEIQPEDYHFKFIAQGRMQPVAYTMDYEGTLEEGIKHVLNNLI